MRHVSAQLMMLPPLGKIRRFKLRPKYPHKRSDGLTWRRNRGSALQR